MAKILVAMSGGVDSSVAAAMLQREGHEVVGCFMRLGSPGDTFDELEPFDTAGVVCDPAKIRIGQYGFLLDHTPHQRCQRVRVHQKCHQGIRVA